MKYWRWFSWKDRCINNTSERISTYFGMPTWWVGACRQDLQRSKCKYLLHFRRHSSRISSTVYCSRFSLQCWTSRLSFRPLFKAFENGLLGKTALKEGCYLLSSNLNETSRYLLHFCRHLSRISSTVYCSRFPCNFELQGWALGLYLRPLKWVTR